MGEVIQLRPKERYDHVTEHDEVHMVPEDPEVVERLRIANEEFVRRHQSFKQGVRNLRWSLFFIGVACGALEFWFMAGVAWCMILFAKSLYAWSTGKDTK